nr:dihydroorotase [Anaeromonas frigoriresistens]
MWIKDGIIKKISNHIDAGDKSVINGKGLTLMPSFIDLHVHLRDPGYLYKEDLYTGQRAALKGGFTHICAMANTNPVCDNKKTMEYILNKHKKNNHCNLTQISSITKGLQGKELIDLEEMLKYTKLFSDDGVNVDNEELFEEVLKLSKEMYFTILTHCEPEAEVIKRDLELLENTEGNLHICHISLKKSLNLIKKYKDKGINFTCEVTPHHLFHWNDKYRVNPSFGKKEDVNAMIKGIKEGYIDIIATDHAPHSEEDKLKGSPGISGIEVAFSKVYTVFKENNISLNKLSEMMSYNPSRILELEEALVEEGKRADLVLVDLNQSYSVDSSTFISKGKNTPFNGRRVWGKVMMTIRDGEIVYKD